MWTEHKTRLLLQIWSGEDPKSAVGCSVERYHCTIAEDLARRGFQCTVAQFRAKIKAVKKKLNKTYIICL